jgi:hypothetical protein
MHKDRNTPEIECRSNSTVKVLGNSLTLLDLQALAGLGVGLY